MENQVRSTLKVAHKKGKYSKKYKSTTSWPKTKNLSDKDSTNVLEAHIQSERKNHVLWNEIKEMAAEYYSEDVILKPGTLVIVLKTLKKLQKGLLFFLLSDSLMKLKTFLFSAMIIWSSKTN